MPINRRAAPLVALCLSMSASAAAAEPLSLDRLQGLADERAPSLLVARQMIELARAELAAAAPGVPENPTLELAAGPRLASEGTSFAFDATFTQSVFVGGERAARIAAAKKALLAAEAAYEVARWSLHAELHQTFDRALVARERVILTEEVEGFQRRLSDIASKKAKAGEIALIDARLTGVELAEARQHTLAARNEYRLACLRLATLIGWTGPEAPVPAGPLDTITLPALEDLLSRAREREPGRALKRAQIELARARLAAERRTATLNPAFGVNVGHEGGIGAEPSITTLQAIVSIPLPTSHKNQGNIARAKAELELAEVEATAHDGLIDNRIRELHAALASAIERAALFDEAILPRISESLIMLERAYAVGDLDLSRTILARERFVAARLDALAAQAEKLSVRAEFERLIGDELPTQPAAEVNP